MPFFNRTHGLSVFTPRSQYELKAASTDLKKMREIESLDLKNNFLRETLLFFSFSKMITRCNRYFRSLKKKGKVKLANDTNAKVFFLYIYNYCLILPKFFYLHLRLMTFWSLDFISFFKMIIEFQICSNQFLDYCCLSI